ncbi:hypothetical protein LG314_07955 [Agrococcus terreus]|uniref:hypothetical protein n=1 Tax=Agrococcus terreus TaxID=574649 RepID=UPI00384E9A27
MDALGFDVIHPQQEAIQQVLDSTNADGSIRYRIASVNEPRRSGKSEGVTGVALGRCLARPGYRVAITFATTGTKLAQRWKSDIFDRLQRWSDAHSAGMTLVRSNGHEGVRFTNGSVLMLLPPKGDSFRSEAFDLVIVDESGEASIAMTETLLQSALPTMDTRPDAQLVVAGTPATFREGNLLWDAQEAARTGSDPDYGAVLYGVPWDLTLEDIETWEQVEPLILAHHPGVGTLTDMRAMQRNYKALGPARFAQEYLAQFGRDAATAGIINPAKWRECAVPADQPLPELPAHFAIGFAVSHDQAFSTVAAAWRDDEGRACVELLEYRSSSSWLPAVVNAIAEKYPRVPLGHDSKGPVVAEAEKVTQARPRTRLAPQSWVNVQTAAALFVREVHTGSLLHWDQEELTDAALAAVRRGEERAFALGRPSGDVQIVAAEAVSLALRLYDETPPPPPFFTVVM